MERPQCHLQRGCMQPIAGALTQQLLRLVRLSLASRKF
jgi:hypothetical protein